MKKSLKLDTNGHQTDNVVEAVLSLLFGMLGRIIGSLIDEATKDVTIELWPKKEDTQNDD